MREHIHRNADADAHVHAHGTVLHRITGVTKTGGRWVKVVESAMVGSQDACEVSRCFFSFLKRGSNLQDATVLWPCRHKEVVWQPGEHRRQPGVDLSSAGLGISAQAEKLGRGLLGYRRVLNSRSRT